MQAELTERTTSVLRALGYLREDGGGREVLLAR